MKKLITESEKKIRTYMILSVFVLFSIFLIGLFWLASTPATAVGVALAYAAGLSMIVLPCTLPLVFIIVPLSMGRGYKKGLGIALAFGAGMITTLTLYGVALALLGQALGLNQVVKYMVLLAGIIAFVFGLAELKLIRLELPAYRKMPKFIERQPDLWKAGLMGLFLGNVGVACPNPATYVIFAYIAGMGDVALGASLQFANGIGRFMPLLLFSILGMLGVNSIQGLLKRKDTINKVMGWGLVIFGAFILVWGAFGHLWFLNTPIHGEWTEGFQKIGGTGIAEVECCIEPACEMCPKGDWIYEEGSCLCRKHLEEGHMDKVCPECRQGLAEGRGLKQIANRTQKPAFGLLGLLIIAPIVWYLWKRPYGRIKKKKAKQIDESTKGVKNKGGT